MLRSDRLALFPVDGWLSLRMFDQQLYLKMPRHWRWLIHCNVAMMCSVIDQVFFTEKVMDEFWLNTPRSPERLAHLRQISIDNNRKLFGHDITEFTCDGCSDVPQCLLAFDGYNTNGDCLASK